MILNDFKENWHDSFRFKVSECQKSQELQNKISENHFSKCLRYCKHNENTKWNEQKLKEFSRNECKPQFQQLLRIAN